MERQNITLTVPRSLLQRFKRYALDHEMSVSAMVRQLMEDALRSGDSYERAYRHWRRSMKNLRNLGTYGRATWTRDELHERR